jgi:hypothetical protein
MPGLHPAVPVQIHREEPDHQAELLDVLGVTLVEALGTQDHATRSGDAGQDGIEHREAAVRADEDLIGGHRQAGRAPPVIQPVGDQPAEKQRLGFVEKPSIRL